GPAPGRGGSIIAPHSTCVGERFQRCKLMWHGRTWLRIGRLSSPVWILVLLLPLSTPGKILNQQAHAASSVNPLPVISRGVPAYTNDNCGGSQPAGYANDATYDTQWLSCNGQPSPTNPKWLAYDLSTVSASQRGNVIVVWYNDCCSYDNSISGTGAYNIPGSYTIDANAAAGGTGNAPTTGWVTLVT